MGCANCARNEEASAGAQIQRALIAQGGAAAINATPRLKIIIPVFMLFANVCHLCQALKFDSACMAIPFQETFEVIQRSSHVLLRLCLGNSVDNFKQNIELFRLVVQALGLQFV